MAKYNVGDAVLKIAPDFSDFAKKVDTYLAAQTHTLDVALSADWDEFIREVNTGLEAISKASRLTIQVEADTTKATADVDAWRTAQAQNAVTQNVDVDTARASTQMATWRAAQSRQTINQTVVTNHKTTGTPGGGGGGGGGGNQNQVAGGEWNMRVVQNFSGTQLLDLANISAAIGMLGSLVAMLGGVVAAAGAASAAVGAIGATALVGFSGIPAAFSAMRTQSNQTATSAVDDAKRQREALDRVADGVETVTDAQEDYAEAIDDAADAQDNLIDAQEDLRDAQQDLNESWADGARELRDLNDQLVDAGHSQEAAAIGLARAREKYLEVRDKYQRGDASGLDLQEADLDVRQAQQRLRVSQNDLVDKRGETVTANQNGVQGTRAVTTAQGRVDNAQEGVNNAQEGVETAQKRIRDASVDLARAQRELAQAQADVATATTGAAGAQNALDAAMAKLSPNARNFVEQVRALSDEWTTLRLAVQDRMFDGMGETFTRFATTLLPSLQTGMVSLAGTINTTMRGTLDTVGATLAGFAADGTFDAFIGAVDQSFKGFIPVVDSLVRAFTRLTIEIGPEIGTFFVALGQYINDTTPFFANLGKVTMQEFTKLLPILTRLFNAFDPIIQTLLPLVTQLLGQFVGIIEQNQGSIQAFAESLASTLPHVLEALNTAMPAILVAMRALFSIIRSVPPEVIGGIFAAMIIGRSVLDPMLSLANNIGRLQAMWQNLGTAATGTVSVVRGVGGAFQTMGNAAVTGFSFLTALPGRIAASAAATKVAAAATRAWVAVQTLFNIVITANPIGLFILALVAVAAAIVVAYNRSETFRNIVHAMWDGIKKGAEIAWGALKIIFETLVDRIKSVGEFFQGLGKIFSAVWDGIKASFKIAIGFLSGDIDMVKKGFSSLGDVAKGIASGIAQAFRGIVGVIKAPINAIGKLLEKIPDKFLGVTIPGAAKVREWGGVLARLQDGGPVAGRTAQGVLYGPGTDRSDSIIGVDENGVPTARVSRDEGVVNARGLRKHPGLFNAINSDDPRLSNLPGFADGGDFYKNKYPQKPSPPTVMVPPSVDAPVQGPSISESEYSPPVQGPTIEESQYTPPVQGPTIEESQGAQASYYQDAYANGGPGESPDELIDPTYSAPLVSDGGIPAVDTSTGTATGEAADRARAFADSHNGEPYVYGELDCSGFMSGLYAEFRGIANKRYFTTESDFLALGFIEGLSDGFQIGIHRGGGGPNSHMAGTLPDGTDVESGGSHGSIAVGGPAAGADDAQFELHYTLPPDKWSPPGSVDSGFDMGDYSETPSDPMSMLMGEEPSSTLSDGTGASVERTPGEDSDSTSDREKLSVPGMFSKAGGILGSWLLDSLGLGDSILSEGNVYNKAVQDTYDFYNPKDKDKKKKSDKYDSNTGNVGDGSPDSSTAMMRGADNPSDFLEIGGAPELDKTTAPNYNAGGGAEQWRGLMSQVLDALGLNTPSNLNAGVKQIGSESGGNPRAQNNSDSNAAKGTPSKGLLQVIDPTFDAFKSADLPDDIWNPAANIFAGSNYAQNRYGTDLSQIWGRGHGYDSGGWLPPTPGGFGMFHNFTGEPEAVLEGDQWATLRPLVDDFLSNGGVSERERAALLSMPQSGFNREALSANYGGNGGGMVNDRSLNIETVIVANEREFTRSMETRQAQQSGVLLTRPVRK